MMDTDRRPPSHIGLGEGEEYELRADAERLYDLRHDAKVLGWRTEVMERLGFSPTLASVLALRRDVDRQRVEDLLSNGAPHELVALILL